MAFVPSPFSLSRPLHRRPSCPLRASNPRLHSLRSPHMKISTNDLRSGTTISVDTAVFRVLESQHVKPGKGAAFVRTKLRNMRTGNTIDKTFKAGEMLAQATLEKIEMQHTYVDGDNYMFMNMETFEEEAMSKEKFRANMEQFLKEGQTVTVLKYDQEVLDVDLPKTLSFVVSETDPGVKGNTAQGGGSKPAIIETGARIMVPLFINPGDKINVNTEEGKYLSRDNS